jgi:thioredoxin-related protein
VPNPRRTPRAHPALGLALLALALAAGPAAAQERAARLPPVEIPAWFHATFLDVREDVREAAAAGRRLLLYFGQEFCPYCHELMRVSFGDREIVEKTRRHFNAVALDIFGARETTWTDGKARSEKELAAFLKIQFTPTLLFLDEKGAVVLRLNGYYPPHKLHAALDYVAGRHEGKIPFAEYLARNAREAASGRLHEQPFLMKPPYALDRSRRPGARPLLVLFEQKHCAACDELHRGAFARASVRERIAKFDVVRLELFGAERVVTPSGQSLAAREWGRELGVAYTPTLVFFDAAGREVFRMEAYLRPFHVESGLDYVASGAYRTEPNFQRFIQARGERIRAAGGQVEVW